MKTIETIRSINDIIALVFFICYTYQLFYLFVPFLKKDRPHKTAQPHRYAILIAARNEASVITQLLDSIRAQDYPADKITAFVVADNCTDNTAALARACGAVVYQRHNSEFVGKGYALDFLLTQIQRDWGDVFDGYFVFDADNLLREDYIKEMNQTFCDGYEIVTSYRNSKNYADNWISSGYALWFLREAQYLNHARMLLGTSCAVSGTGFLFSRRILHKCGGWKFFLLTEDIESRSITSFPASALVIAPMRNFLMNNPQPSASPGGSAYAGRAGIFRFSANMQAVSSGVSFQKIPSPALICACPSCLQSSLLLPESPPTWRQLLSAYPPAKISSSH